MRWASALLLACLASLFAAPSLHAETAPTYEFVFETDRERLAKRSDGPIDIDAAMQSVIAVAKARLNGLEGSYSLSHEGEGRLVVQITHAGAPRIARDVFGVTGDLDFLLVDLETVPLDEAKGIARPGSAIYPMANGNPAIAVRLDGGISGDHLVHIMASIDANTGESVVQLQFDEKGKQALADFTGANVGRPIAIVLDGEVLTAPTIQEAIRGGLVQISGNFTRDSANQLAIILRSGALPTPLVLVAERVIAPASQPLDDG